ncbi:hypothetical protein HN51_047747 [Arachis hypogaea]|nr:uncharacterized protein DS421_12g369590 [Arachis hypogaea]
MNMKFGTILPIAFVLFALFSHTYSGRDYCQEEVTMEGKCGKGMIDCMIAIVQKVGKPLIDATCRCDSLGNNNRKCICTYVCVK